MTLPEATFLQNDLSTWLTAVLTAIIAYVVFSLARQLVGRYGRKHQALLAETPFAELLIALLQSTRNIALLWAAIFVGSQWLTLTPKAELVVQRILILVLLFQAALWGGQALSYWVRLQVAKRGGDGSVRATLGLVELLARMTLYVLLILVGLNNLGVNITALIAGLGVGGIAIALALQSILGDLFASATIILDKPFVPGDFIIVGDEILGTVERIGLKTTRIQNLAGEKLICPNANLLQSRIRNYKRMENRRVVFSIGVLRSTSLEKLERVPVLIRSIVESLPKARFDRSNLSKLADSSIEFETVWFVLDPDYNLYMDLQQKLYLEILRGLADEGIELAYPTQTIQMSR